MHQHAVDSDDDVVVVVVFVDVDDFLTCSDWFGRARACTGVTLLFCMCICIWV